MRAITVRQPWAWQIINQGKDVENRTRNIAGKYRGPVLIHAALKADEEALARLPSTALRVFDYGVVLGVVDLVDVHHCFNATTKFEGCSPWAELDRWHLVLANPRPIPLAEQFKVRGALGLWTPSRFVVEQVQAVLQ